MGGRGSASNVTSFGTKYGARLNPTQYKEAVHAKANFLFRELEQDDAVQIILRRSYRNGVPIIEVSTDGINVIVQRGLGESTIQELKTLAKKIEADKNASVKSMHDTKTWSGFDEYRAERQVNIQALKTLQEAIKLLKKRK